MAAFHGVVVLGVLAVLVGQTSAGVHHVLQTCAKETGATLDDAQKFLSTGEATQGLKCAFSCAMKAINVINDDGTMKIDTLVALNPADKADIVRKCSTMTPGDQCENAYLHYKCALESDPDYFNYVFNRLINDF